MRIWLVWFYARAFFLSFSSKSGSRLRSVPSHSVSDSVRVSPDRHCDKHDRNLTTRRLNYQTIISLHSLRYILIFIPGSSTAHA
ncbi:hypothetical protein K432DRAFT_378862 [Lepidopterella palustris CBS 459.81]|uniref:Secreted protein n=1 Tax=Lepidopterella palustris CBS 459.81 TaxID=1314670 RepID=A0A8E2EHI3_9PEZI|nr:hypothetical protein K432DRAFT_378862 [Lepidopterella palustris CBS 459.81]